MLPQNLYTQKKHVFLGDIAPEHLHLKKTHVFLGDISSEPLHLKEPMCSWGILPQNL